MIAQEIVAALGTAEGFASFEIAGAGYINARLDRVVARAHDDAAAKTRSLRKSDIHALVEHTSINPNKAAHIGHLRNAILGDTFVRLLRAAGQQVDGAELHRQHRRAGGGCGGRLSASGEEVAGRSARAD